jgi:tRNA pseudouridine38-40 synthase
MGFLLSISYLGTYYHGWQTQANAKGVQQVVEEALSKILEPLKVKKAFGIANAC